MSDRDRVLLRLQDADGNDGLGEAAPLPGYDAFSARDAERDLERCRSLLEASDGTDRTELLARCAERALVPHALAAIDMALWDLAGRRAGQPVWRLLGAPDPRPIEMNWTISSADRAGASREAARARRDGYPCVKVKVAVGDDGGRLAAVRAAGGPELAIRLDANGAWSVQEAADALRTLEPVGIELCEEPVHGLEAIGELSELTGVALSIDESAELDGALDRRFCAAVCLKIGRCGGITGLLSAARRARAAGYEVYLASALDGPVGIAAALHAALAIEPDRPCGLATLGMFAEWSGRLPVTAGAMRPPQGPGLGDSLE